MPIIDGSMIANGVELSGFFQVAPKMIKIIESIVIVYYLPEEEMDLLYSF